MVLASSSLCKVYLHTPLTHPIVHTLLLLLLLWVLVGWWVLSQWKNHQQSLAAQTLEFLRWWFGKVSGFLFSRCWKESGMFFGF